MLEERSPEGSYHSQFITNMRYQEGSTAARPHLETIHNQGNAEMKAVSRFEWMFVRKLE
jgi:hypothetical protein